MIKKLIIFLVGFCGYITIEVLYRGYSYPLMGVVSGLALLLLDSVNNRISWDIDIIVYGLIGSSFVTLAEFVIGTFITTKMWDYSNVIFNYKGIICIPFSIAWFFLSIIGVFIADAINYYVFAEEPQPYYLLCGYEIIKFKKRK